MTVPEIWSVQNRGGKKRKKSERVQNHIASPTGIANNNRNDNNNNNNDNNNSGNNNSNNNSNNNNKWIKYLLIQIKN